MTPLKRHCRLLLGAYPAWYRRDRAGEMLGTLLEASPPGRRWPSFRDARALVIGGFRVRGWVWLLSMLWVGAGAVLTGFSFTSPPSRGPGLASDLGLWGGRRFRAVKLSSLGVVVFVGSPVPVPIAGFIRLRGWRRGNWLRTFAWAGAWIAGVASFHRPGSWVNTQWTSPAPTYAKCSCRLRRVLPWSAGESWQSAPRSGTRGPDDPDTGRASPRPGCARYQQPVPAGKPASDPRGAGDLQPQKAHARRLNGVSSHQAGVSASAAAPPAASHSGPTTGAATIVGSP